MNKLNDLTLTVITRVQTWAGSVKDEQGSQGIEAGGAALAAMAIVGAVIAGGGVIANAVRAAMERAAAALGG